MNCPFCDSLMISTFKILNLNKICFIHCLNDKCEVYPYLSIHELLPNPLPNGSQLGDLHEVSFKVNNLFVKFYPENPAQKSKGLIFSLDDLGKEAITIPLSDKFDPFTYKGKVRTPVPDPNPDKIDTLEKKLQTYIVHS